MNSWDKCKNCGGDYALHHYETNQCPRNGVEAPLNRKQEWMTTTFELVDTRDAQIAQLRTDLAVAQAVIVKDTELMRTDEREQEALRADLAAAQATIKAIRELIDPLDGQTLEDAISDMLHDDSSYEPYRDTIKAQGAALEQASGMIAEWIDMPAYESSVQWRKWSMDFLTRTRAFLAEHPAPAQPRTIIDAYADGM